MRSSPINRAIITPKMSGGVSGGVTAVVYGGAGLVGYALFNWHPWAAIFPVIVAWLAMKYYKYQFRQDVYFFDIRKNSRQLAHRYHPWPREVLRGRGRRPRGFGRGLRC